jgi:hypothetical protein
MVALGANQQKRPNSGEVSFTGSIKGIVFYGQGKEKEEAKSS